MSTRLENTVEYTYICKIRTQYKFKINNPLVLEDIKCDETQQWSEIFNKSKGNYFLRLKQYEDTDEDVQQKRVEGGSRDDVIVFQRIRMEGKV